MGIEKDFFGRIFDSNGYIDSALKRESSAELKIVQCEVVVTRLNAERSSALPSKEIRDTKHTLRAKCLYQWSPSF